MNKFKIGDEVIIRKSGCRMFDTGYVLGIGIFDSVFLNGQCYNVALKRDCVVLSFWERELEKVGKIEITCKEENKKINKMQQLTNTLKRFLTPALQSQYKAGYRNGNLELTEEGKKELLEILAQEKEVELTKVAEEKLAEEK